MARYGSLHITRSPDGGQAPAARSTVDAMRNGFLNRCPHCAARPLFRAFLKPVDACPACGEEMHHHRADDLPAYLVIVVVGHLVVGSWLMTEALWTLPLWLHLAIWGPITMIASILLLQPVKGAVIGLQWANRMHGFGDAAGDPATAPLREPLA